MKKYKPTILIVILFSVMASSISAQESLNSGGRDANSTSGSVAYSIGQLFVAATGDANNIVIEGVQQPFEISVHTGIEEGGINLEMLVYPNPAQNELFLKIAPEFEKNLWYQLVNLSGQEIIRDEIHQSSTKINVRTLSRAIYFLQINNEKGIIKSFKIIKK